MSVQRYSYQPEYITYEGDLGSSINPDDDGEWVKFSDHQSSLAERELRIATLRAALKHEVENCVNCEGQGMYAVKADGCEPEYRKCERCAPGRAALAATEGAQYPRVEKAPAKEYDPGPGCHAGQDGECWWSGCPQLRDGEPVKSGRHCPLDTGDDDED